MEAAQHDRNGIPAAFGTTAQREPVKTHAAQRALERYGVELSLEDVRHLARRCKAGEGLLETAQDGSRRHTLIHDGRVLWVVYRLPREGGPTDGLVVTVTPPSSYAVDRVRIADRDQKWKRKGGKHFRHRNR